MSMAKPLRNSTQSVNGSKASAKSGNKMHFVNEGGGTPILDFIDEIEEEGGKVTDFRYNVEAKNADGKVRKTCLLTFKKAIVDENGEVVEFKSCRAFASDEAHTALVAQRGTDEPFDGITVSEFYVTDPLNGKETGETSYVLCKVTGESGLGELNALRQR